MYVHVYIYMHVYVYSYGYMCIHMHIHAPTIQVFSMAVSCKYYYYIQSHIYITVAPRRLHTYTILTLNPTDINVTSHHASSARTSYHIYTMVWLRLVDFLQ